MKNLLLFFLLFIAFLIQPDFAGRYYDAATSRWLTVDPKASKYLGLSPYNYCLNNPLRNVDLDGKEVTVPVYVGVETNFTGHAYILSVDDNTGATTSWSC